MVAPPHLISSTTAARPTSRLVASLFQPLVTLSAPPFFFAVLNHASSFLRFVFADDVRKSSRDLRYSSFF